MAETVTPPWLDYAKPASDSRPPWEDYGGGSDEVDQGELAAAEKASDLAAAQKQARLSGLKSERALSLLGGATTQAERLQPTAIVGTISKNIADLPYAVGHAINSAIAPEAPRIDPEKIKPFIRHAITGATTPSIGEENTAAEGVVSGTANVIAGLASPETAVAIASGAAAPEVVGKLFLTDIAGQLPGSVDRILSAKTSKQRAEAGVELAAQVGTLKLIHSGLSRAEPKPGPMESLVDAEARRGMTPTQPAISETTLDRLEAEAKSPETKTAEVVGPATAQAVAETKGIENAPTAQQIESGVQPQRIETETRGIPAETSPSDSVQRAAQVEPLQGGVNAPELAVGAQGTERNQVEAPKWTTATQDLGGQMLMGIPDPVATYKSAVALGKQAIQVLSPKAQAAANSIRQVASEVLDVRRMNDQRRAVLGWSAKLQKSFGEAASAQKEIETKVPDKVRREGITNWIQADGDTATLTARRDATTDPKLRAGYDAALNLTPDEIAVANDARAAFGALGIRGQAHDVLKSFKDNYVTQIWDLGKGPTIGSTKTLRDKFRFSRASTFPTYFDGEQAGYTPKTKDIAKILPVYLHEMNTVIAARQLVQDLSKGVASDGRPLVSPKGVGVPVGEGGTQTATLIMPKASKADTSDYRTLENQPALNEWKWASNDSQGNPVLLKADLALHPEAYKQMKAVLGRSAIREWYQTPTTATAAIPKAIVKGIVDFQGGSKRTMLGLMATFHQVQEGTHAIGHRVNPFFNIPKIDLVGDAMQVDAAKHGLMLLPDRVSGEQFMEGFRTSGLVSRIPAIGPIADWYSNYLFHQYIPGLKFKTYNAILERNMGVFDKDLAAGSIKPEDVKALSAEQTNAAYGHLNYADLARNPTMQHLAQIGLLAPDFLEARLRFAGQALKGSSGAKVGREQVIALGTLAVAQATLAWIGAKTTGGTWDEKHPFEFTKDNRRYTMRSVPEDTQRMLIDIKNIFTEPGKGFPFLYNRLSPVVGRGIVQGLSGRDFAGRKVTGLETAREIASSGIPLTARSIPGLDYLTGTDRPGNVSPLEQLASSLGLKVSRANPSQELFDLHQTFLKNNPDPKVRHDFEQHQRETFVSDFKPLDTALQDGNDKAAVAELKKLRETHSDKAIVNRMKQLLKPQIFHGNKAIEGQFVNSLTPEQATLYQKALEGRRDQYEKFVKVWSELDK